MQVNSTMKISVDKEYDGKYYVACCTNVPGCYVQSERSGSLNNDLQYALEVYLKNCVQRNQPFPNEQDRPVIDVRIRFEVLSSAQLIKIMKRYNYHVDYQDPTSVLLLNSEFPFNRIHIPNTEDISPLIIRRIFGRENTLVVGKPYLQLKTSAS